MTVREQILRLFELNRGKYLSGEELAEETGCTRAAIWKAVKTLKSDGYSISAVRNRGYRLEEETDVLSETGVRGYLSGAARELDITVFGEVGSTNTLMREYANSGAPEGRVIIAGSQTEGRGRMGRTFFSPSDTGLYMSILLRPELTADKAVKITTAAAAAVCEAIEKISELEPKIKWVNDVYLRGKKVCGILTEAGFSTENNGLDYAVAGIGINVYEPEGGFSEDIRDIAGPVFTERKIDARNRLAGELLNSFTRLYGELAENSYHKIYEERLMWIGEEIYIISQNEKIPAKILGVDSDCRLRVEYGDGSEGVVASGEISIRRKTLT